MDNASDFLSTVQVGITFTAIITGALGGTTFSEPLGNFFSPYIPYSYQTAAPLLVSLVALL